MQRVMIIGCGGSGKSTLAHRLSDILKLPVIHLDSLYWQPGWVASEAGEFKEKVARETVKEQWIMDGNYSSSFAQRLERADTVICLELPRWVCLYRVILRRLQYKGRCRPDMAEGCPERIDFEFLLWILWNYNKRSWPRLQNQLALASSVNILRFRSPGQIAFWLQEIEGTAKAAIRVQNPQTK